MPSDFVTLLRRDHSDIQQELTQLLDPMTTIAELRDTLDGVRLGLTAHAEAEDIVLSRFDAIPALEVVLGEARASHRAQESALVSLCSSRPGTAAWRDRAHHLRELVRHHAIQEESQLLPALRTHAPEREYAKLAGAFATERLRQLSMLQPSAPVFAPFVLAEAQQAS